MVTPHAISAFPSEPPPPRVPEPEDRPNSAPGADRGPAPGPGRAAAGGGADGRPAARAAGAPLRRAGLQGFAGALRRHPRPPGRGAPGPARGPVPCGARAGSGRGPRRRHRCRHAPPGPGGTARPWPRRARQRRQGCRRGAPAVRRALGPGAARRAWLGHARRQAGHARARARHHRHRRRAGPPARDFRVRGLRQRRRRQLSTG